MATEKENGMVIKASVKLTKAGCEAVLEACEYGLKRAELIHNWSVLERPVSSVQELSKGVEG